MVLILVLADVHGTAKGVETAHHFIAKHKPDMMVVAGDITHFGPPEKAAEFLDSFKLPLLAVNGNCDTPDVVRVIKDRAEADLIDRIREAEGLKFAGLGYPSEWDFADLRMKAFDVMVSHVPPKGCNDTVPGGGQIGDAYIWQLVSDTAPRLVITGHVHESRGICDLGESVCVNPGPARDGCAALARVAESVEVELLDF